jgi:hypothetical protein
MNLKLKKWFLAGLLGLLLLPVGCRPDGVIPSKDMESLLAEFYLADACIETMNAAGSDSRITPDSLRVYLPILVQHGYTDTMFQLSLAYYLHRPKELVSIYKHVRARLEKAADEPLPLFDDSDQIVTEEDVAAPEETSAVQEGAEPPIEKVKDTVVTEKPDTKPEVKPSLEDRPASLPPPKKKSNRKRMTQNDLKRLEEELKK